MKAHPSAGFHEVDHGADAALEVWAPDLAELFSQSARGMLDLMGVESTGRNTVARSLALTAADNEALLVAFLSRLLFMLEQERLVFSVDQIRLTPGRLEADLLGAPAGVIQREIKAVTFNDLAIRRAAGCLSAVIVFDV
jgi:SHS2 domain-containing protein